MITYYGEKMMPWLKQLILRNVLEFASKKS